MNIGIVSNINPIELSDYLYNDQFVPDTRVLASSVQALVSGLIKLGHNVIVFSTVSISITHGKKCLLIQGDHLKIYLIRVLPKVDFLIRHLYLPNLIASFIKQELFNIDVLHSQWTYECSAATVDFSGLKPTFCSVRDWWPVQFEYYRKMGFHQKTLWGNAKRKMFIKTMKEDRITFIANSEYTQKKILDLFPNYDVPIIPNPIKEKYIIKNKDFLFNDKFISISISLFEKRKNIETLLEAFRMYHKRHDNSCLKLIGQYSKEHELFIQWDKKGLLEGVELLGVLTHDKVLDALDEASVLIHPSLEETFGNILLEAMARRLLVIGGENSGAVPSVLGEGKYGILCNMQSVNSLFQTMEMVRTNRKSFENMVNLATSYLISELSDIAIAKKHIELYKSKN